MTLYKVHERNECRDDAMILGAETERDAAERYARLLVRIDEERYGAYLETDYVVLVRVPGGIPKRFNVMVEGPNLIVREWPQH